MIKNKAIPLAPLAEQKRIVEMLDVYFEKLDEAKERLQEQVDYTDGKKKSKGQIDIIRKSILAKAFRGELGTGNEKDENALNLLGTLTISQ